MTNHDPQGRSVVTLALAWPPLLVERQKVPIRPRTGKG